jgi:excisionase family DNA binding protein
MQSQEEELTITQVARLIGAGRSSIWQAIQDGRLAARRIEEHAGPLYLIRRRDAERYRASVQAWHDARPSVRRRRAPS